MNQEKSNRIKIIVKIVSFVLVTIALIGVVTLFLHPEHAARYSDERSVEANRIFDERENSIDVIFLGHSGVYSGISPMEIYKNTVSLPMIFRRRANSPGNRWKC